MSLRTSAGALIAFVLLAAFVAPAQAATCTNVYPWHLRPVVSCDKVGGACPVGAPVTVSLIKAYSWAGPTDCATVTWKWGDGSPDVTIAGAETAEHVFSAVGTYTITASITTAAYGWPSTETIPITVGNGFVTAAGDQVNEGETASLLVTRSNVVGESVISWSLLESGVPATGVVPASGTVTIPEGSISTAVTVATTNDEVHAGNRVYSLVLTSASGGYTVPANSAATLYVTEDDFAVVRLDSSNLTDLREDIGPLSLRLTREGLLTSSVTIRYEVGEIASGVVPLAATITFAPGQTEAFIPITIVDDAIRTENKRLAGTIYRVTTDTRLGPGSYYYEYYRFSFAIADDEPIPAPDPPDPPPTAVLTMTDAEVAEGDAGTQTNLTYTLRLSRPVTGYVWVSQRLTGSASRGADYTFVQSWWYLYPGETEKKISVTVIGDDFAESHETIVLNVDLDSYPDIEAPPPAVISILNDDAGFGPDDVRIQRGGQGTVMIDVGGPASSPVTFALATADDTIVSLPSTATVEKGQGGIEVTLKGLAIGWTRVTATPPTGWGAPMSVTVEVHEAAGLVFDPGKVIVEPDGRISVRASLDPPSAEEHTVQLKTIDPSIATADRSVIIPPGASGTFTVKGALAGFTQVMATLPKSFGSQTASLDVYVALPAARPLLRSVVPSTGSVAGGTAFEANGALLSAGCTLLFGGVPATDIQLASESLLTGTTPAHSSGTVAVELLCGADRFLLDSAYTYLATPPALSAVTPGFGSVLGGTQVRVTATNVRSGCWLFLDNVPASGVETHGTTEMTAVVPPHATTGSVTASIRCGDASASLPSAFTYTSATEPSASLMNVTPMAAAPGEPVTITGSRLRQSDRVTFDDRQATRLSSAPDAHVVRVPELPLGIAAINLTDAEGRVTTTGPIFTVLEPARPAIESVAPASAPAGAEVELRGESFRPFYSFVVGGKAARTVSLTPERVVIRLSSDIEPGTHSIFLVNESGHVAVIGPAVNVGATGVMVSSISPACGSTEGSAEVTIYGSGFQSGAKATFNGVEAAQIELVDASTIRAILPAGATGFARVAVANADGSTASMSDGFRYRSPFDPQQCAGSSRSRSIRH